MTLPDVLKMVSMFFGLVVTLCYSYQILYLFVPLFYKGKDFKEGKLHRYAILIAARNAS